jgi:dTDP-4-amino-4,6-dideoxygalactose transaminase
VLSIKCNETAPGAVELPVFCPTLPAVDELQEMLLPILSSCRITVGAQVKALELEVCQRVGVQHTVAVSSGTSALMLMLRALALPVGGEVITPSFTFGATVQALLWLGLKPIFCDSDPATFVMDPAAAAALITPRTVALYPVNIFGVPADNDAFSALAQANGLVLIHDSAQGIGSSFRGVPVGNFGIAEAFSMSPTKVVTAMEGGMITTNDAALATQLRALRDYGKAPDGEGMAWLGLSARMPEINAAVARWSLARLDRWIANRARLMTHYRERLGQIPGFSFQHVPTHTTTSRNYMVVVVDLATAPLTRDALFADLLALGIQTKRYFYPALHNQLLFRELEPGCATRLPVAERLAATALALPMYSHMELETVDGVCDRIVQLCQR